MFIEVDRDGIVQEVYHRLDDIPEGKEGIIDLTNEGFTEDTVYDYVFIQHDKNQLQVKKRHDYDRRQLEKRDNLLGLSVSELEINGISLGQQVSALEIRKIEMEMERKENE